MDLRKYQCDDCFNRFWVDRDNANYPNYCTYCAAELEAVPEREGFEREAFEIRVNVCSSCSSPRIQPSGTCQVCIDCGATTGCS